MKKHIRILLSHLMGLLLSVALSTAAYGAETPLPAQSANGQNGRSVTAVRTSSPVRIDGVLSEPDWSTAEPATGFLQREPSVGDPASERTDVRILYDNDNLYIGVTCYDSAPERIVRTEMSVDGELRDDDNFSIVLDTFNDKRNGFMFMINPNGARWDATIGDSGFGIDSNEDWNGIWDVSARVTDEGWTAEVIIPFRTLRFPAGDTQAWGINFRRIIAGKNEEVLWSGWRRNDGIMQLTKTGALTGLSTISRGKLIEAKPYVLGGMENNDGTRDDQLKYGLDVKYPLSSHLTLDLTTNTDFAQVEVDDEKINLTRFDLRYEEKRDFFLEGADIFAFASTTTAPFYSRRIGISPDREQIPILGGAKVTGKAGKYNIGVLSMQSDKADSNFSTNYSVVRMKRDLFEKSYIGVIATNLVNTDNHRNSALGTDFSYKTDTFMGDKNLAVGGYMAMSRTPGGKNGTAGRVYMDFPNDTVEMFFLFHARGNDYDPEIGFVDRPGVRQYMANIQYMPRPDIPYVRKLTFQPVDLNYYTDMSGRLISRSMRLMPFGLETSAGDEFELYYTNSYEYLTEDFNIFDDVNIKPGAHDAWYWEGTIDTNESRRLSLRLHSHWGEFYSGDRTLYNTSLNVKINRYLTISNDIEHNIISIGDRSFETRDYSLRFNTNVSTRLTARTYVQWNNDNRVANVNFRIHYIPRIGSDVYFVYNHLWDGYRDYDTLYNAAIAKIAYQFTF